VQACIEDTSTEPPVGWKIAATSKAGSGSYRGGWTDGGGDCLAERLIPDGGRLLLGSNLMKVAEMEFAFRFWRGFGAARRNLIRRLKFLAAVSALHPAIETAGFPLRPV